MVKLNVGFFIHPFRIKNISCWLPKTEQFQSDHVSLGSTRRSFRQYQGFNRYMVRKLSFSHCLVSFYCFNLPFFIFSLNNWSVVLKITLFFYYVSFKSDDPLFYEAPIDLWDKQQEGKVGGNYMLQWYNRVVKKKIMAVNK